MVIHKLIPFLRKGTFWSYFLNIKKPNQLVLWRQTNNTILYLLSISAIPSLFSSYQILSSDPFSLPPMVIQFPCGICSKAVGNNHQAIKCDQCNLWIHIKCNKINKQTCNHLKSDSPHWFSISCIKQFLSRFSNTPKSIRENFIQAHSENNSSWQLYS